MACKNIVGFETGSATAECMNSAEGTFSIQSTKKRSGSYALRTNPTTTDIGRFWIPAHDGGHMVGLGENAVYIRFYFMADTLPASANEEICACVNIVSAGKLFLRITSAGKLQVYDLTGTTQLGSDGATTLSTGVWYRIEIYCETGATSNYEVRINGATELSGSGDLGTAHSQFILGKVVNRNGQSVDFYYDDVAIDTTDWPGDGSIKPMLVNSDGTYTTWTIGAGGGSDWENVDEIPPDGSTSYLYSDLTIGNASTVGFQSTADAGISGLVYAVKWGGIFARESSDAAAKLRLRSGGTDYDSALFYPDFLFTFIALIYQTDPNTSAAWTMSSLDAIEVGGVEQTNVSGDRTAVTSILLFVDYKLTSPRSFGIIVG